MSKLSIKVQVAGRGYPLSVKLEEEEHVRKAASSINESFDKLKAAYPLADVQDLITMAALEVTTRTLNSAGMADREELKAELATIEMLIGQ